MARAIGKELQARRPPAVKELDIATQLDPTDEHIYMARQRAQQEWSAASGATGPAVNP